MIENYEVKTIFEMSNYFDEIAIINIDGIIQYCEIFVRDVYSFTADEVIGKHVFDIFPTSTQENSEIMQVLRTGKPIVSYVDNFITYKNDVVKGYCSIYPIYKHRELQGAALALKFIDENTNKEFIQLLDNKKSFVSRGTSHYTLDDIITEDSYMLNIKRKIQKIASNDSNVLIQGNTGTGKEIAAQSIHYASKRADQPFISQNCSAIPANLLESIIFGTEKGSFTGAITNKGLFELANKGTLFLDEINSMDISLQVKLLKAIEEKSIRRLGGHEKIHVDIRIISAINEDSFVAIKNKHMRQDLYYRLSVVSLTLSDLKDRGSDLKLLTNYYINHFNHSMRKQLKGLHPEVELLFKDHTWPGNIRELRNIIEGAFNFAEGKYIRVEDLPNYIVQTSSSRTDNSDNISPSLTIDSEFDYDDYIASHEKNFLLNVLKESKNKTEAAKKLKLSKQVLNYKLDKYELKG